MRLVSAGGDSWGGLFNPTEKRRERRVKSKSIIISNQISKKKIIIQS